MSVGAPWPGKVNIQAFLASKDGAAYGHLAKELKKLRSIGRRTRNEVNVLASKIGKEAIPDFCCAISKHISATSPQALVTFNNSKVSENVVEVISDMLAEMDMADIAFDEPCLHAICGDVKRGSRFVVDPDRRAQRGGYGLLRFSVRPARYHTWNVAIKSVRVHRNSSQTIFAIGGHHWRGGWLSGQSYLGGFKV